MRLAFGTVTAAGTICRKDELIPGKLIVEKITAGGSLPYTVGMYAGINRIVANNINYIANLAALMRWYEKVRALFVDEASFPRELLAGMHDNVISGIEERISRLDQLCEKMPEAVAIDKQKGGIEALIYQKEEFYEKKEVVTELLHWLCKTELGDESAQNEFLETVQAGIQAHGRDYLNVIRSLDATQAGTGTAWLRSVVDHIMDRVNYILPSFSLMDT